MAAADLLTIKQAAAALNLSEARIHQLLANGDLDSVALPRGRKRHVPGVARVTTASVDRLLAEREEAEREHDAARAARVEARAQRSRGATTDTPAATAGRESVGQFDVEAARAAAMELKVRLDTAREQVRRERERSDRLLEVAAKLVDLLRESSASAVGLDDVAEGYSDALTQLLAPGASPEE